MYKVKVKDGREFQIEPSKIKVDGEFSGTLNGSDFQLDILKIKDGTLSVIRNNRSFSVDLIRLDHESKSLTIMVDGITYDLEIKDRFDQLLNQLGMNSSTKTVKDFKAPMPGKVLDVMIKTGDTLVKDQPMLILEAMKMENVLKAPADVVVKSVTVDPGVTVEKNHVLITFE